MPYHKRSGYCLNNVQGRTGNNPLDATTYYLGFIPASNWSTTAAAQKIYIPKAGRIRNVLVLVLSSAVTTNEDWSMYLRVNDTTDYLIATLGSVDAEKVFLNGNMEISVAAGDFFEIKTTTPTWVTNPINVLGSTAVIVEGAI